MSSLQSAAGTHHLRQGRLWIERLHGAGGVDHPERTDSVQRVSN